MAHFARVENGIVRDILVVSNDALDPNDEEGSGRKVLEDSGFTGEFVQCSYNGSFRGAYPSSGWLFDGEKFYDPQETIQ